MKRCPVCRNTYSSPSWHCPACSHTPAIADGFLLLAPELADGGGGFDPRAFAQLAALEDENFWFRARNRLVVWALERHFPRMRRYMEIGCGTGFVLRAVAHAFPQAQITGSEIFRAGLKHAASRASNAELLQMDARQIPYCDEFDAIGAFDVLEHIDADLEVLCAMERAVRPGGGVVLTVPQHPWLWSEQDELACHVRPYRKGELRDKVAKAGFEVQLETSFVSLLLPAMAASRRSRRRDRHDEDGLSELRLAPILNHSLKRVMDLERYLIEAGVRFGAGGSLLLVATKQETP